MARDIDERSDLISSLEFLGKMMPNQNSRAMFGLVTQPDDGSLDRIITDVPSAVTEYFEDGSLDKAASLLKKVDGVITAQTKARNYGYDIEGHHPVKLASGWYIGSDLPMSEHLRMLDNTRSEGVHVGTMREQMIPLTRKGHNLAHLDPLSHKANFRSGFLNDYSQIKDQSFDRRYRDWIDLAGLEERFSRAAYNSPQETEVRRFAGDLLGLNPSKLASLDRDPNYITPAGRPGRLTYAQTSWKQLGEDEMARAITSGWGNTSMGDIITPETRITGDPPSFMFDKRQARPGQIDIARRMIGRR